MAFLAGIVAAIAGIRFVRMIDELTPCVHEVVREFPSPNGRHAAIVLLTNCGATTLYVTSVAIKWDGHHFDYKNSDADLFRVKDKNNIEVEWNSAKSGLITTPGITIIYDHPRQIYRQVVVSDMEPISYIERQKKPHGGLGRSPQSADAPAKRRITLR